MIWYDMIWYDMIWCWFSTQWDQRENSRIQQFGSVKTFSLSLSDWRTALKEHPLYIHGLIHHFHAGDLDILFGHFEVESHAQKDGGSRCKSCSWRGYTSSHDDPRPLVILLPTIFLTCPCQMRIYLPSAREPCVLSGCDPSGSCDAERSPEEMRGAWEWKGRVGHTLWLFNIAMENGPFIDGLPIYYKWWFSMAILNNQMVFSFDTICFTGLTSSATIESRSDLHGFSSLQSPRSGHDLSCLAP